MNSTLVDDPTAQLAGFHLPQHQWSLLLCAIEILLLTYLLNRFRTGQGHCSTCLKKWCLRQWNVWLRQHPDNVTYRWFVPADQTRRWSTVVDQKNLKRRGTEDNLSAPSSFIANAHNEIYAFYTEKVAFWKKWTKWTVAGKGGGRPHRPPPFNPPMVAYNVCTLQTKLLWLADVTYGAYIQGGPKKVSHHQFKKKSH